MRTFEWLLWLVASSWAMGWAVWRPAKPARGLFEPAALITAALHFSIEGARFHMLPAYALLVAMFTLSCLPRSQPRRLGMWVRVFRGMAVTVAIVVAAALPSLFPVFAYEKPAGPYGIGTAEYELKDGGRNRDLVIQAWYPVAPRLKGRPVGISTRPEFLQAVYASLTGLPKPLFDHLRLIRTHAIANAPLTSGRNRFPVVLFSHGPGSANRSQSVFQMEALASHGYIAVAIDHTGYASTTTFPDGRAVPLSPNFTWPAVVDQRSRDMTKTWVADVQAAIDKLETLNELDPSGLLTGRLDLSRVGYLGASFGGSVVVQALIEEPRIKAGVALDGKPYFIDEALTSLRRPLLYMQSAAPYIKSSDAQLAKWGLTSSGFRVAEQDHYARLMQLFSGANGPVYNVYIRRTNHVTFSDLYLIIDFPDSQLMDIRRAHRIINDYTIAFFDRFLNGTARPLVDGSTPSPYPEVTVASRNATLSAQLASK